MSIKSKLESLLGTNSSITDGPIGHTNATTEVVEVSLDFTDTIMKQFITEYLERVALHAPYGFEIPTNMDHDMLKYFEQVLNIRACVVTNQSTVVKASCDTIIVPGFISLLFNAVGEVKFEAEMIRIVPKAQRANDEIRAEWKRLRPVRDFLHRIEDFGFVQARTIERSKEGEADFMTFVMVDSVLHHRFSNVPASDVFLRCFLNVKGIDSLWNSRISYTPMRDMELLLETVTSPITLK